MAPVDRRSLAEVEGHVAHQPLLALLAVIAREVPVLVDEMLLLRILLNHLTGPQAQGAANHDVAQIVFARRQSDHF